MKLTLIKKIEIFERIEKFKLEHGLTLEKVYRNGKIFSTNITSKDLQIQSTKFKLNRLHFSIMVAKPSFFEKIKMYNPFIQHDKFSKEDFIADNEIDFNILTKKEVVIFYNSNHMLFDLDGNVIPMAYPCFLDEHGNYDFRYDMNKLRPYIEKHPNTIKETLFLEKQRFNGKGIRAYVLPTQEIVNKAIEIADKLHTNQNSFLCCYSELLKCSRYLRDVYDWLELEKFRILINEDDDNEDY